MSKSVVPAAAVAHAKHLVNNKNLAKRPVAKKPAQDEQQAHDHKDDEANAVQTADAQNHQLSMSDAPLGTFSFANALSDAAASTASLTVETSAQDDGGSFGEERDGSGPILLVAAGGLAIAGAVAAFSGGGGKKGDDTPLPQAPVFTSGATGSIAENSATSTVAYDANVQGNLATTFALSGDDADAFDFDTATGVLTFKDSPDFEEKASYNVSITATNEHGSTTQAVTINVTNVNEAPEFTNDPVVLGTEAGAAVEGAVTAEDPDAGDTLTYEVVLGEEPNGSVEIESATGEFTYTPNEGFTGVDTFDIVVKDAGGLEVTQTITVNVGPQVNEFDIDGDSPSDAPITYALTDGADRVLDDANVNTNALLVGLEQGDIIVVTNAEQGDYNFIKTGNDIKITYGADNGQYNIIQIANVVTNSGVFVHDYDSAALAVGFDFMNFA